MKRYGPGTRIVCGVLATLATPLAALGAYEIATSPEWRTLEMVLMLFSESFIAIIFGKVAVTGRGFSFFDQKVNKPFAPAAPERPDAPTA